LERLVTASPTLRVCALYPTRMNIYADRGNLLLLEGRCRSRGIGFRLTAAEIGETIDPSAHDLFYLGGGQDADQRQVAGDLVQTKHTALAAAVDDGKVLLAICGGYQLLGEYYEVAGDRVAGLGLVDLHTVREAGERLIGNALVETSFNGQKRLLAGFENHGGRTYLGGGSRPLGHTLKGHGNNGRDGGEGVHVANVFGTYLHGPLLPKNVWLADHLVQLALGGLELEPLDDEFEDRAHERAMQVARAE
jgi:CobQ-like glutamine amidotransferase family enzyme